MKYVILAGLFALTACIETKPAGLPVPEGAIDCRTVNFVADAASGGDFPDFIEANANRQFILIPTGEDTLDVRSQFGVFDPEDDPFVITSRTETTVNARLNKPNSLGGPGLDTRLVFDAEASSNGTRNAQMRLLAGDSENVWTMRCTG